LKQLDAGRSCCPCVGELGDDVLSALSGVTTFATRARVTDRASGRFSLRNTCVLEDEFLVTMVGGRWVDGGAPAQQASDPSVRAERDDDRRHRTVHVTSLAALA
jgi:hypothetical protein